MPKQKKATSEEPTKAKTAWETVRDTVKSELKDAAELASLQRKLSKAEKEKKSLLCELGQVYYRQLRPIKSTRLTEPDAVKQLATRIDQKTAEIVDLRIQIKLRKTDMT